MMPSLVATCVTGLLYQANMNTQDPHMVRASRVFRQLVEKAFTKVQRCWQTRAPVSTAGSDEHQPRMQHLSQQGQPPLPQLLGLHRRLALQQSQPEQTTAAEEQPDDGEGASQDDRCAQARQLAQAWRERSVRRAAPHRRSRRSGEWVP
eukprot:gb/GFBE01016883.1/.p1 GENE.gb/GFBE01016883.1/~~gb/GFBE01016883.1/.p1  ORF type:complete len:149 (+),score=20.88 gb/GFBE01016883.1/:1-447(+)